MKDKVVVVTGAAGGIGRAVVERFLKEGCHVVMADVESCADLAGAMAQAEGAIGTAYAVTVNVGEADQVEALFAEVTQRFGKLDVLVNNAGITLRGQLDELSLAEIQAVVATNLMGPILCSRAALPMLRTQPGASIVNVASELALIGAKGLQVYCATKGGVVSLTKAMAIDHAPDDIRVNAVCPGPVLTPMIEDRINAADDPVLARQFYDQSTIMERVGLPHEIANAVWFAASPQATFMTGSTLVIDGGATAA
ncbi:MAG: SDR family oxidoreductase [Rhodospirillaceae bacterium]|nr:SDR family oxidoreductase [Rhodospirillaceae bacterium]MBT7613415.1 SDR family oxidoreductase [Rhodospirillaceae bacterium]MBT7646770.1 SDR family oxidoreductase [Rhodospirillaceae bacterium]